MESKKLPDDIVELVELAIADLEKCEKDPEYQVDMFLWHEPRDSFCLVCFAGAVMAKSLDMPKDAVADPHMFQEKRKLRLLNDVRCGVFHRRNKLWIASRKFPEYHRNPKEFKAGVRAFAAQLKAEGFKL